MQQDRDLSGTLVESGQTKENYRILAAPQENLRGVIFDVDDTLYRNPAYRRDVASREFEAIGSALGWPINEAENRVRSHRQGLGEQLGRPARLTETVKDLGLTQQWWDDTRNSVYRPEDFITGDARVPQLLEDALARGLNVAVATNSPSGVAERILTLLGASDDLKSRIQILGPDKLGVAKPDPAYFIEAARRLNVSPQNCLSIGDDEQNDALPAIEAGMGAVVVSNVGHLRPSIAALNHEQEFSEFDLEDFARSQFRPGEVTIMAFCGRAGAGKTTTAGKLADIYRQNGIRAEVLGLDAFFRLSSAARRAWLEEGKQLGPEEYAYRADQANWWDFDKASETLDQLRQGRQVQLRNIYNRADKGELTGELEICPDSRGTVVVFEGVATAHFNDLVDKTVLVSAHPQVRKERLLGRDLHRAGEAALERFRITQDFENRYFGRHSGNANIVIDNTNGFLRRTFVIPQL